MDEKANDQGYADLNLLKIGDDYVAAGLIIAATVARKRGWEVSGKTGTDQTIFANLQKLRDVQSGLDYEEWTRDDDSL